MGILYETARACRSLAKAKGFTTFAAVTLALGIGLATTMFSIVDALVLRGLPFENADRLMHLELSRPSHGQRSLEVPVHDYMDWRARQRSFTGLAAFRSSAMHVAGGSERATRVQGSFITANAFELFGTRAALGRTFSEDEDRPGAAPVVLLGHTLWRDRFHADPSVIGGPLRVNGEAMTIVGVMPERFQFPIRDALWIPLRADPSASPRGAGDTLEVFGMLAPGTTEDQARAEMAAIARALEAEHPAANAGLTTVLKPYAREFVGENAGLLLGAMLGAVLAVLLVACANVANLLLARAATRTREIGVRMALGAPRGRLVAQFLSEALVLAALGGVLGLVLIEVGVAWFNRSIPWDSGAPFWIDVRVDARAIASAFGLVSLAALVSGIAPAIRASGANAGQILSDNARTGTGLRIGRLSRALVASELALACGVLVAAGLMIRTVANLNPGTFAFATADVLTARVNLFEPAYPNAGSRITFYDEVQARSAALPGVRAVALALVLPGPPGPRDRVAIDGSGETDEAKLPLTTWNAVTPGFFETFAIGVQEGRTFTSTDGREAPLVAIVNRSFAQRMFPDRRALGRRVRLVSAGGDGAWRTIVGVVPDVNVPIASRPTREGLYMPLAQAPEGNVVIALRTQTPPLALTEPLRDVLATIDPDLAAEDVRTMAQAARDWTWGYRVIGRLFAAFGVSALFLSAVGVYGVMAFSVGRRSREIGVRMALGASRRGVLGLVLGQGVRQLAVGLAGGLMLALGLGRLISVGLVGVSPSDVSTFLVASLTMSAAGLLASFVPAWRASRVDPMVALRDE